MPDYLVVRGESHFRRIADACTFELEQALVDGLGADVYTVGVNAPAPAKTYRAVFFCANSFRIMSLLVELASRTTIRAETRVGYIFAGYMHTAKPMMNPVARMLWKRYKHLASLDTVFLGTEPFVKPISEGLKIPMHYAPMAANVYDVHARVGNRPIAITGFGRQERKVANFLSDQFNRPDSDLMFYNTNFILGTELRDWRRYRAIFWQILRQSRLSMAYDHLYYNPSGTNEITYVGPRWFEGLAAGTVVVGKTPQAPDVPRLLDWEDATIDLPDEAEPAVQAIRDLLADRSRLEAAIRRNIVNMSLKHDWRHRAVDMLNLLGLDVPGKLTDQIGELKDRAEAL